MKKNCFLFVLQLVLTVSFGQSEKNYDLHLSTGTVTLAPNFEQIRSQAPSKAELFQGTYYRYVQFVDVPSKEQKDALAGSGFKVLMYLPYNTFVVAITKNTNLNSLSSPAIRSIHPIKAEYKMLKELKDAIEENTFPHFTRDGNKIGLGITYYENCNHDQIKSYLRSRGYKITAEDKSARSFVVWVRKSKIEKFVALPFVSSAELVDDEPVPDNNVGRTDIRSNSISTDYSGGRNYNGQGVDVALQDDGRIGPHIDYEGRIPNTFVLNNNGDHGDHCGGTIMGAGNLDPAMRGMAWGANLHVYSASGYQAFNQITTHYNTLGIRIISTSYSDGCNAGYTTRAQQLDMQNLAMPELIHVFSAGNDGNSNCGYGAGAGWGNVTGGHKHSKNSIAVANLTYLDVRNGSSSRGPAHDGRLKPEVSAVGTNVWSTSDTNRYVNKTGTSMSCPAVAGVFAQLYQAYKNLNSNVNPSSALMKAIVMNSADDLGNPGPDFGYGYGRINALKAVQCIEQNNYLSGTVTASGINAHTIVIPTGVKRVKVMTYWHDFQAQVGAGIALVNDLNTTLTDPGSTVYNPLVLNFAPNVTSLNSNAAPGIDNRNNHEQITLDNPVAGNYVLNVNGFSVPMGPQSYVVTWIFEMEGFTITYPIGGEGFIPGIVETIRWDANETSGAQTLEYTSNNGTTWNTISTAIPGSQRYFNWTPPNIISGQCRVKISRGIYAAESDTNFSIIARPFNLQVGWVCPDSVQLNWTAVAGATSYDIFRLGTTYMDSIATSISNSVVVTNVPINQTSWFSVRSRGPLDAVSRRAIAVQKKPGILACPQVAYDVACDKVISPFGTITDCQNFSETPIVARVSNPGINTLSLVTVYYSINGGTPVSENFPGSLNPSASIDYTFSTRASFATPGTYSIKTWAKYNTDPIITNDTSTGKIIVVPSLVRSLPLTEDFESFNLCSTSGYCQVVCGMSNGFVNEDNIPLDGIDHIDWRTHAGPVPTSSTGPQVDFSNGTVNGKYVYLESSAPCSNLNANLLSPCVDLSTATNPTLTFAYHMYGATMGTLHLDLYSSGTWTNSIWSLSGDQGDGWKTANVNLSAWAQDTVTFRWRGTTAVGNLSDMALDAISIAALNPVGINNNGTNNNNMVSVYPNPADGIFNVEVPFTTASDIVYRVTDLTGREILSGKTLARVGRAGTSINLHGYAPGVYTLNVNYDGRMTYIKLNKL